MGITVTIDDVAADAGAGPAGSDDKPAGAGAGAGAGPGGGSPAGIAQIVMENPPVNALTVAGWYEIADHLVALGRNENVRVVILRAEGRGFNAGVDLKEIEAAQGFSALVAVNRACAAAFAAVYDCPVPVIAAVHGYCLGGGIGLVGNSDIIIAADDASFGLPEVDRGALGAATHLARLVPQHKMRAMVYTSARATADELQSFGSVHAVVPPAELLGTALGVARQIAAKAPVVIRAAKQSLNGIDLWDVKRSYRYEQGFTFELNLLGEGSEHRAAYLAGQAERAPTDEASRPAPEVEANRPAPEVGSGRPASEIESGRQGA